MAALHLRPHHLLCIQNYRGHGYSEGFNQKMLAVIEVLQQAGGAQVRIIEGADDLCSSCPNCSGGECTSGNPALFDSLVLQRTCLVPGDEISLQLRGGCRGFCLLPVSGMPAGRATALPGMTRVLLEECCPGCSWQDLCFEISAGRSYSS